MPFIPGLSLQIVVVFLTIAAVESRVNAELQRVSRSELDTTVLTDLSASERIRLFKVRTVCDCLVLGNLSH